MLSLCCNLVQLNHKSELVRNLEGRVCIHHYFYTDLFIHMMNISERISMKFLGGAVIKLSIQQLNVSKVNKQFDVKLFKYLDKMAKHKQ